MWQRQRAKVLILNFKKNQKLSDYSDYVPSEAEETEDDTDYVDSDDDSDLGYSVAQYLDGTGYPDELNNEDYKRIDEYYESQKGNTPNDKLIGSYFRPSFSESLHICTISMQRSLTLHLLMFRTQ